MLQIPRRGSQQTNSPYASLGLKDLPFPALAVADPYNTDPRRNGAIYAEDPVRPSIEKFEQLLIRPNDFQNRVRLAYLWSSGDEATGRGMGKTALLRYFRQRINHDWGQTEFVGRFSAMVVYVSFPSQVDRRYMEQLALSALVDICKSRVLESSQASLRLDHLTDQQVQQVVTNADGSTDFANLLDDEILNANGIDAVHINQQVANRLVQEGVQSASASALAVGGFEDYLKSFRRDHSLEPFYVPRDTKILEYSRGFLFNDMVIYLRAAGFEGGYLFIDDIENLVDQMTRRHRVEFAKEFALCTLRPGYANTTHNFFSCVLTTHQQASVGLSAAWGEAGLAGIARLDPNDPNSVELPLPSADQAREIIVAHLDYYRDNPEHKGSIEPFTEDGMVALLKNRQHPRILLTAAAAVVSRAAQEGVTSIDAVYVETGSEGAAVQSTPDFTEGIEGAV
jgi:hypothetical protein